ncbi:transmembrane protein 8B isoform X2 [Ixodes scapularis]
MAVPGMKPALRSLQIFVLLVLFTQWECVIAESDTAAMSQSLEPRQVYPFRRYGDVTLLPFLVSYGALRASWSFRANVSRHCTPEKVHLYLQYGGLPVLSPLNATFPDNFVTQRQRLRSIVLDTDSTDHFINVTSPDPGQWFGAAFTLDPHQRIVQKDLFAPCKVFLSSTLSTYQLDGVTDLLLNQSTAHRVAQPTYFRFSAPHEAWSVNLTVTECKQTSTLSAMGQCPLALKATSGVAPVPDEEVDLEVERRTTAINCSADPCQGSMAPEPGEWSYLLVEPVGGPVEFKLLLTATDCKSFEESRSAAKLKRKPEGKIDILEKILSANASVLKSVLSEYLEPPDVPDTCWPSYELMHVNMPGAFEYGYRLDHSDSNFSSSLNLSHSEPTLVTFRVFPVVDTGGTLSITLRLHAPEQEALLNNITVRAVLTYGSRPRLRHDERDWDWGSTFAVNTSSAGSATAEIHLPYPEAGLWYLGLLPLCYLEDRRNASVPDWVPCEYESLSVELSINSSACLNQKCGLFGRCFQYISGGIIFSSCYCSSGYRGWGCTDSTEAQSYNHMLIELLLLTLSNLFFLPAILLAVIRRHFLEALVYTATMFSSAFYHACDADLSVICVLRPSVLQYCDFLTATVSLWVTLLCLADLSAPARTLVSTFGVLCIAIAVENDRMGLIVIALPVAFGLTLVFVSWMRQCFVRRSCFPRSKIWLLSIVPGAALAVIGVVLYTGFETRRNYAYVHSAWHALVGLSLFVVLPGRRKSPDGDLKPDPINPCSYVRVEELSDMTPTPEPASTARSQLVPPGTA